MKVVYFHQYFTTPEMAGGTRSYEFARRLVADGHEVHVITSDTRGGDGRTEIIEGIKVSWIPVPYSNRMSFFRRLWAFVVFALLATLVGVRTKPTVVFATSTPLTIVFPALVVKWVRRVPMVFEVRDLWPEMPIAVGAIKNPAVVRVARWMERLAYFQSCRVVALSPGMKTGVVSTGYPESQVVVVPNSSDIDRFQIDPEEGREWLARQSWSRGGPMVLYAGTLGTINGVDYLVEVAAAAKTVSPEVDFVVIGTGKMEAEIRRKATDLAVLGFNFHLVAPMSKQMMPLPYAASTIALSLFQPVKAMENNSANKFYDALASGTPLAINYGGWHRDLLEQQNCGISLSRDAFGAANQLSGFITRVLADETFGQRALQLACDHFDRQHLYLRFRDTIAACVSTPKVRD